MMNDDSKHMAADADDVMDVEFDYDHGDLAADVQADRPASGSGMRKLLLPAVALVAVAGAGGYLAVKMPERSALTDALQTSATEAPAQNTVVADAGAPTPEMVQLELDLAAAEQPPAEADLTEPVVASAEPAIIPYDAEPAIIPPEAVTPPKAEEYASTGPLTPEPVLEEGSGEFAAVVAAAVEPAAGDDPMAPPPAGGQDISEDIEATPEPQVLGMPTTIQSDPIVPLSENGVAEVQGDVQTPDGALAQPVVPAPGTVSHGMPDAAAGDVTSAGITSPAQKDAPDTYYDSRLNVPTGPLADTVGPRKVDPTLEPGSKYVVARKTYDSSDSESMIVAAGRALALGRYESALDMYNQMYEKNKRDPRILMGRAVAQQHLGMDDLAILSYEELLVLSPNSTEAVVNLMGLIQKQYPSVALRRLTDLQQKHPNNAGIAAQIGMAYAQAGDHAEALRSLGTAASLEPTNALHYYNMAVISDRLNKKAQAINFYEQALEKDSVYGGGRSVPREKIYDRLSRLRSH